MKRFVNDQFSGQILGKYAIEQLVGRGQLSDIYAARHVSHGNIVALTAFHLPDHFTEEEKERFFTRFSTKAHMAMSLQHRHILPILAAGIYHSQPYLISPYLTHGSLATFLTQRTSLTSTQIIILLEQAGAALSAMHAQRVIHGMVHPGMLLLDDQGCWLLSGLALRPILQLSGIQQKEPANAHWYNVAGLPLFPPAYMPPEQLVGRPPGTFSDVYALGALLVYAISGQAPYQGGTPEEVLTEQRARPFSALALRRANPALASAIEKALAYEPAERFSGIEPFVTACITALEQAPAQVAPREDSNTFTLPQEKRFTSLTGEPQEWFTPDKRGGHFQGDDAWVASLGLRTPNQPKSRRLNRRQTITLLATGGIVVGAAAIAKTMLSPQTSNLAATKTPAQTKLLPANAIGLASMTVNSAKTFHNPKDENESLLIHLPNGTLVAYERACTHVGVSVNYNPTTHTLNCPAHGAIFDPAQNGKVLQGPATRPLPAVAIQVKSDGTVVAL